MPNRLESQPEARERSAKEVASRKKMQGEIMAKIFGTEKLNQLRVQGVDVGKSIGALMDFYETQFRPRDGSLRIYAGVEAFRDFFKAPDFPKKPASAVDDRLWEVFVPLVEKSRLPQLSADKEKLNKETGKMEPKLLTGTARKSNFVPVEKVRMQEAMHPENTGNIAGLTPKMIEELKEQSRQSQQGVVEETEHKYGDVGVDKTKDVEVAAGDNISRLSSGEADELLGHLEVNEKVDGVGSVYQTAGGTGRDAFVQEEGVAPSRVLRNGEREKVEDRGDFAEKRAREVGEVFDRAIYGMDGYENSELSDAKKPRKKGMSPGETQQDKKNRSTASGGTLAEQFSKAQEASGWTPRESTEVDEGRIASSEESSGNEEGPPETHVDSDPDVIANDTKMSETPTTNPDDDKKSDEGDELHGSTESLTDVQAETAEHVSHEWSVGDFGGPVQMSDGNRYHILNHKINKAFLEGCGKRHTSSTRTGYGKSMVAVVRAVDNEENLIQLKKTPEAHWLKQKLGKYEDEFEFVSLDSYFEEYERNALENQVFKKRKEIDGKEAYKTHPMTIDGEHYLVMKRDAFTRKDIVNKSAKGSDKAYQNNDFGVLALNVVYALDGSEEMIHYKVKRPGDDGSVEEVRVGTLEEYGVVCDEIKQRRDEQKAENEEKSKAAAEEVEDDGDLVETYIAGGISYVEVENSHDDLDLPREDFIIGDDGRVVRPMSVVRVYDEVAGVAVAEGTDKVLCKEYEKGDKGKGEYRVYDVKSVVAAERKSTEEVVEYFDRMTDVSSDEDESKTENKPARYKVPGDESYYVELSETAIAEQQHGELRGVRIGKMFTHSESGEKFRALRFVAQEDGDGSEVKVHCALLRGDKVDKFVVLEVDEVHESQKKKKKEKYRLGRDWEQVANEEVSVGSIERLKLTEGQKFVRVMDVVKKKSDASEDPEVFVVFVEQERRYASVEQKDDFGEVTEVDQVPVYDNKPGGEVYIPVDEFLAMKIGRRTSLDSSIADSASDEGSRRDEVIPFDENIFKPYKEDVDGINLKKEVVPGGIVPMELWCMRDADADGEDIRVKYAESDAESHLQHVVTLAEFLVLQEGLLAAADKEPSSVGSEIVKDDVVDAQRGDDLLQALDEARGGESSGEKKGVASVEDDATHEARLTRIAEQKKEIDELEVGIQGVKNDLENSSGGDGKMLDGFRVGKKQKELFELQKKFLRAKIALLDEELLIDPIRAGEGKKAMGDFRQMRKRKERVSFLDELRSLEEKQGTTVGGKLLDVKEYESGVGGAIDSRKREIAALNVELQVDDEIEWGEVERINNRIVVLRKEIQELQLQDVEKNDVKVDELSHSGREKINDRIAFLQSELQRDVDDLGGGDSDLGWEKMEEMNSEIVRLKFEIKKIDSFDVSQLYEAVPIGNEMDRENSEKKGNFELAGRLKSARELYSHKLYEMRKFKNLMKRINPANHLRGDGGALKGEYKKALEDYNALRSEYYEVKNLELERTAEGGADYERRAELIAFREEVFEKNRIDKYLAEKNLEDRANDPQLVVGLRNIVDGYRDVRSALFAKHGKLKGGAMAVGAGVGVSMIPGAAVLLRPLGVASMYVGMREDYEHKFSSVNKRERQRNALNRSSEEFSVDQQIDIQGNLGDQMKTLRGFNERQVLRMESRLGKDNADRWKNRGKAAAAGALLVVAGEVIGTKLSQYFSVSGVDQGVDGNSSSGDDDPSYWKSPADLGKVGPGSGIPMMQSGVPLNPLDGGGSGGGENLPSAEGDPSDPDEKIPDRDRVLEDTQRQLREDFGRDDSLLPGGEGGEGDLSSETLQQGNAQVGDGASAGVASQHFSPQGPGEPQYSSGESGLGPYDVSEGSAVENDALTYSPGTRDWSIEVGDTQENDAEKFSPGTHDWPVQESPLSVGTGGDPAYDSEGLGLGSYDAPDSVSDQVSETVSQVDDSLVVAAAESDLKVDSERANEFASTAQAVAETGVDAAAQVGEQGAAAAESSGIVEASESGESSPVELAADTPSSAESLVGADGVPVDLSGIEVPSGGDQLPGEGYVETSTNVGDAYPREQVYVTGEDITRDPEGFERYISMTKGEFETFFSQVQIDTHGLDKAMVGAQVKDDLGEYFGAYSTSDLNLVSQLKIEDLEGPQRKAWENLSEKLSGAMPGVFDQIEASGGSLQSVFYKLDLIIQHETDSTNIKDFLEASQLKL